MELLQLRYFLAAAKYQHMTKAAEHLQIAQPALSQAIHRLETELGVPLFIRRSRGIELNETGLLLQQRLLPIIESLDRIPEELREGAERAAHTIHSVSYTHLDVYKRQVRTPWHSLLSASPLPPESEYTARRNLPADHTVPANTPPQKQNPPDPCLLYTSRCV